MFTLLVSMLAADVAPSAAMQTAICEVGRAALQDLPTINHNPGFDAYYTNARPRQRDLLVACPQLQSELPRGFPLADDEVQARAAVHAPTAEQNPRPAFIYSIGVPEVSEDLKTAIVHMEYSCTGLCGANFEARYVRTPQGWKRQGQIQLRFIS